MFQSPNEVAFRIFGFPVYFYGIIMAVSIFIGIYVSYLLYKKYYKDGAEKIFDFMPYIIIIGIIGARLYYCIVNYSYYSKHLLEIFFIRQGGLSIHGMIISGIISLFVFAKIYKMSFLKLADCFLCGTALAQSIGRWGNFFNSEAFGLPCNLPWKLYIPIAKRPLEYINYEYFHPTFLYESILDFMIFLVLILLFKKSPNGRIACLYLILYSLVRFFVESLRIDSVLDIGSLPVAQVMSLIILTVGVFGIIYIQTKKLPG